MKYEIKLSIIGVEGKTSQVGQTKTVATVDTKEEAERIANLMIWAANGDLLRP